MDKNAELRTRLDSLPSLCSAADIITYYYVIVIIIVIIIIYYCIFYLFIYLFIYSYSYDVCTVLVITVYNKNRKVVYNDLLCEVIHHVFNY